MRYKIFFLLILLVITACTHNEPVIMKEETAPGEDPTKQPEIIEIDNEDQEAKEEFIEFSLPGEKVVINLQMVPILKEYLHPKKNRLDAISNMNLFPVISNETTTIYLLEFSCKNDTCSYLLLNQSKDHQAYLLADIAKHMNTSVSPDHNKLLFKFNRSASLPVPLSDLVVVDIVHWKVIPFQKEITNNNDLLKYKWPIITAEWIDNETITASIPALVRLTDEHILTWQKNGSKATNIILHLDE